MNKNYLTNRGVSCSRRTAHWSYREAIEASLQGLGVPRAVATLAVIDYSRIVVESEQNKLTPEEAANIMVDTVKATFQRTDGTWLCAN